MREESPADTMRELERLVRATLTELGHGWRLHSVVALPHDSKQHGEQRVDDYNVIFEGP